MPTGACGINCDACGLHLSGTCGSCGPGTSEAAAQKAAVQVHLFARPCPVLACAMACRVGSCLSDCRCFPCGLFRSGYPYSDSFLDMQARRRRTLFSTGAPMGDDIMVPETYWETLSTLAPEDVRSRTLATPVEGGYCLPVFGREIRVDLPGRKLLQERAGRWAERHDPLLALVCLLYLLNADPSGPQNDIVSEKELKEAHFFRGPHALKTGPVIERFSGDLDGFRKAAEALGGRRLDLADAAYSFAVLPKVPVQILFWDKDEDFEAGVSVLFDRSVERHFAADGIWGLVTVVCEALASGF